MQDQAVPETFAGVPSLFAESTLRVDAASYASLHKRAHLMLGHDLLEPLTVSDSVDMRVARPRSAEADEKEAATRRLRPQNVLAREGKWSDSWVRREERVSSSMRRHVLHVRATSGDARAQRMLAKR